MEVGWSLEYCDTHARAHTHTHTTSHTHTRRRKEGLGGWRDSVAGGFGVDTDLGLRIRTQEGGGLRVNTKRFRTFNERTRHKQNEWTW